jgi:hypothetical protein
VRELLFHFAKLLAHFLERPLDCRPVEADAGGAVL